MTLVRVSQRFFAFAYAPDGSDATAKANNSSITAHNWNCRDMVIVVFKQPIRPCLLWVEERMKRFFLQLVLSSNFSSYSSTKLAIFSFFQYNRKAATGLTVT